MTRAEQMQFILYVNPRLACGTILDWCLWHSPFGAMCQLSDEVGPALVPQSVTIQCERTRQLTTPAAKGLTKAMRYC